MGIDRNDERDADFKPRKLPLLGRISRTIFYYQGKLPKLGALGFLYHEFSFVFSLRIQEMQAISLTWTTIEIITLRHLHLRLWAITEIHFIPPFLWITSIQGSRRLTEIRICGSLRIRTPLSTAATPCWLRTKTLPPRRLHRRLIKII